MKKNTKIILATLVILSFGFGLWKIIPYSRNRDTERAVKQISTIIKIDGNNLQSFDVSGFIGKSALEATESIAKVVISGTGVNAFVTSINSRSADTKKHEFWELDVNGGSAQVGAGSYIIQEGDSILWLIDTY